MAKIEGLDALQKKLEDVARKAKEIDGKHDVPVSEFLTDGFLSQCTKFSSVEDMFKASGFTIESQEDFAAIPDDQWNDFIRSHSSFDSWQAMLEAAGKEWAQKKLGL